MGRLMDFASVFSGAECVELPYGNSRTDRKEQQALTYGEMGTTSAGFFVWVRRDVDFLPYICKDRPKINAFQMHI